MSIRDRQIANAEARALQSEMQAGRYPELTTIQRMIADVFSNTPAGLPQFQLASIKNDTVSNPDTINVMLDAMLGDINTGFDEVSNLENQMMGMADYYETEKNKVNKAIVRISRRIKAVTEKMKYRTQSNVINKHFHDFLDVELTGDNSRSIPATTVLVDLLKGIATLDKTRQGAARYDITKASIDVQVSGTPTATSTEGDITNILNDAVNSSWRYAVTTTSVDPVTLTLTFKLASPIGITTVGFLSESPAATSVTLYVSSDNITYVKQGTKSLTGIGTWNIPMTTVQYVKLELRKTEPDATKGTDRNFYFGANRIFMQRDMYQTEGKLVSGVIPVGTMVVDQIGITPVESKLPGTNIRYYAAIDDGVSRLEWVEADQNGIVSYNAYKDFLMTVDGQAASYGRPIDAPQLGNQNYTAVDLTPVGIIPAPGSTKLYIGEQMWQVDSYGAPAGTPVTPVKAPTTTGPQDWSTASYVTQYVDLKQTFSGKQMTMQPGTWTRMTVEFQVDIDQMPFVQKLQIDASSLVSVYLNNTLLGGVRNTDGWDYTYKYVTGLNKIVIYIYTPSTSMGFIAPNLDLMSKAIWARASSAPLSEMSLYNLYNNTSVKDRSRFAWKGSQLVLNYNPGNVRFALACKYTLQQPKSTNIRFMAIFTRSASASDTSAQLDQYQLVVR